MLYTTRRVLFVFAHPMKNDAICQKTLQRYQDRIQRTAALGFAPEEYYLLVVTPHVPPYLQCTPEIQAYVKRCAEEDVKQLSRIGARLGIPTERQYIAEGNPNWEALRLAKALSIDDVQGYSTGFLRFLTFRDALRARWEGCQSLKQSVFHALRRAWQPRERDTAAPEAMSSMMTSEMDKISEIGKLVNAASNINKRSGGEAKMMTTHLKTGFLLNASRDKLSIMASKR